MREATTTRSVDYFHLPRPLWRKLKKCLPKNKRKSAKGGRPRASDRAVINAQIGTCSLDGMEVEGHPSRLVWGVLQRGPRTLPDVEADGHLREADEEDGRVLRKGVRRDRLEVASYGLQTLCGSFGRPENGQQPHRPRQARSEDKPPSRRAWRPYLDRTQRGQPPRHKVSAIGLIVSVVTKGSAHKEQHLCADKAYDADDLREFLASAGYEEHIKVNPRRKGLAEGGEHLPNDESSKRIHPARRWIVERTISWLVKRRSLRTRWAKKAENWLALIQLACSHILLNLAVFG